MNRRASFLGIVIVLVGCGARPPSDGAVGTSAANDGDTTPYYGQEFTYSTPTPCTVYVDSTTFDPANEIAQYVVHMGPQAEELTLLYRMALGSALPLDLLIYVGSSSVPVVTVEASEGTMQVLDSQQAVALSVSSYLQPASQVVATDDAGAPGPFAPATADAGTTGGLSAQTLADIRAATLCLLPSRADLGVPAFILNRAETSAGSNVVGYSPDGAELIPWSGPNDTAAPGTLEDGLYDEAACLDLETMTWTCPAPSGG